MEKDEKYLVELRDCFTGGYTLPQFCIDNGIKKPLFVAEEKFLKFVWEAYVQFRYDKRMLAQFAFLDLPTGDVRFSILSILEPLRYKNFSEVNLDDFDKIILLTMKDVEVAAAKKISFNKLTRNFLLKTYVEIPLLNFLRRHPQVKLFLTKYPAIGRYEGGEEFNNQLVSLNFLRKILRKNKSGEVKTPLDKFGYTNEEVLELIEALPAITNSEGIAVSTDNLNPLSNVVDGKRVTAAQPEKFLNKIYFVGSCHDQGINAPFDKTIESYLQKMLNEHNLPYRVENESQRYWGRYQDIFYTLNSLNPAPDDIIFMWFNNLKIKNLPFFDAADAFDTPHDFKEAFCMKAHFNEIGYKLLAEKYFNFLTTNNFFREKNFDYPAPPPICHRYGIPSQFESGEGKIFVNEDLEAYKKFFAQKKFLSARSS